MLILTRKKTQTVVLITENGERISVVVNKLSSSQCSLGFDAPKGVKILRSELKDSDGVEDKAA